MTKTYEKIKKENVKYNKYISVWKDNEEKKRYIMDEIRILKEKEQIAWDSDIELPEYYRNQLKCLVALVK